MNIYLITNNVNNKQYVGLTTKSIEERLKGHLYTANRNRGYYLHKAIRKYGVDNFSIELIDTAENITQLKEKEIYHISRLQTYENGYNLTKGGDFSANKGMVVVKSDNGNKQISVEEFKNGTYDHVNKNLITLFKDDNSIRVSTHEYKSGKYPGWYSKNKGFTTVINQDGTISKIKSTKFDSKLHKGVQKEKQICYNSITEKFQSLFQSEVDTSIHYNNNKVRYKIYNNEKMIEISLNKRTISDDAGRVQFNYMMTRNKTGKEFIITRDVLDKLKKKVEIMH